MCIFNQAKEKRKKVMSEKKDEEKRNQFIFSKKVLKNI